MCNPAVAVAAGTAALNMYGTAMSIRQQHKAASAQAKAVRESGALDYQALIRQYQEANEDAARLSLQRQLQTARYRSRIRAVHADRGVSGQSPMQILNQALMAESYDLGVIEANRQRAKQQTMGTMQATQMRMKYGLDQARGQEIGSFGQALMIGASGLQGAQAGWSLGSGFDQLRVRDR